MKQKIQILPENLCNKIAAGEVVERPASVVKELLENAIDAGATEITVEVERGGKRLIRVVDDGEGMGRDDALLCLERHATSKIRSDEDLFRLHSLGFRGEALPSIAAVSRFALCTCAEGEMEGWEVYAEGGVVKRAGATGAPRGTTVEVRDLFFNTPARRKFLRRDETEMGHVGDVVTKLAMAHPVIHFRLLHNGRKLIDAYRQTHLGGRVSALLGRPLMESLVSLEDKGTGGLELSGLVAEPSTNRSTSGGIYTYINGRYIRDRVVQHAILEGYRSLMAKGRYPVAVLFLRIDPELVDVNVHPTKHEVRFRNQREVHDFVAGAVQNALRPASWVSGHVSSPARETPPLEGARPEPLRPEARSNPPGTDGAETSDSYRQRIGEALQSYGSSENAGRAVPSPALKKPTFPLPHRPERGETGFFSSLTIIGQYRRSYLLCQEGDDLMLIDQHAAHERIAFERIRSDYAEGGVCRQNLLFPEVLEFDFREGAIIGDHLEDFERLGFEIEPFGGKSFALKAVPALLAGADAEKLVRDVIGEIGEAGASALVEEALDGLFMTMACHRVVRANQSLAPEEIAALLEDLDRVDFKGHCPHGRPVVKRLRLDEVERMFQRS